MRPLDGAPGPADQSDMTPDQLKSARQRLNLSQGGLAAELRLGGDGARTVRRWEHGERAIPGPVEVALEYMLSEAYSLNGGLFCP